MNIFKPRYYTCQQDNAFRWICVGEFDSWKEADEYSHNSWNSHKDEHYNVDKRTTLVKVNNIWPEIIKQTLIQAKLTPYVSLTSKYTRH